MGTIIVIIIILVILDTITKGAIWSFLGALLMVAVAALVVTIIWKLIKWISRMGKKVSRKVSTNSAYEQLLKNDPEPQKTEPVVTKHTSVNNTSTTSRRTFENNQTTQSNPYDRAPKAPEKPSICQCCGAPLSATAKICNMCGSSVDE